MGSGPSLGLSVADSLLTPGQPVVLSEPIEHDFDAFVDESLAVLKYPVAPHQELVLKECKVTDDGPDSFTVKVVLDGAKLTQYGYGNPEDGTLDRVENHSKIITDRAARTVRSKHYQPHWVGEKDDEQLFEAHVDFLSDPLRIEYWWSMADGTRKADDVVLGVLQPVVNQVLAGLQDRKVEVKFNSAKPSVISQPVEESVATYEVFFNALVTVLKATGKPDVEEISETKAKLTYPALPSADTAPTAELEWDKDNGTICGPKPEKLPFMRYKLSKEPVILEAEWIDAEGKNITTTHTARTVQGLVDGAIASTTGSSWFGLF